MAHPLALGLAAIALGLFGAIAPAAGADGESEKFELTGRVRVVTGGIIVVARQEVHLWAIEAATLHQPCSPAKGLTCGEYARITLQQMATGRKVWCQIKERPEDALHVIARCELRNNGRTTDLSAEMVRLGYAYAGGIGDEEATGPYAKLQHRGMFFRRPWIWRERYAGDAIGKDTAH